MDVEQWTHCGHIFAGQLSCLILCKSLPCQSDNHSSKNRSHPLEMAAKTTFVLVPGGWHPAVCLEALTRRLQELGHQVRAIDHKSIGAEPPLQSFDPDVEQVHDVIEQEADGGQDIAVFMHSYGGLVGTEACRGLSKTARAAAGKEGGVTRLIYCCAFILPEGMFEDIDGRYLSCVLSRGL